jgi:hypothetical protein
MHPFEFEVQQPDSEQEACLTGCKDVFSDLGSIACMRKPVFPSTLIGSSTTITGRLANHPARVCFGVGS